MQDNILEYVGRSLYKFNELKEYKRYVVFRTRCLLHKEEVGKALEFFAASPLREELLLGNPSFLEQITRSFFYKGSRWAERRQLVQDHVQFLEENFQTALLKNIYIEHSKVTLWQDVYNELPLQLSLWFHPGQRKEGCLSLVLSYEGQEFYQIMFWIGPDRQDTSKASIYIGALQGVPNGSELIKGLTKAYFGYRTKNLIFYGLRALAKSLGMERIYAVGNEGYYAMNHVRRDRKLKTDFGAFWLECEGEQCSDPRFYVMPVAEYRKDMSELKPSKRAQHRRRFEKMDEIDAAVASSIAALR